MNLASYMPYSKYSKDTWNYNILCTVDVKLRFLVFTSI